jgi:Fe-S cluster biogenesis protein NfuA/nitrite reductase/ring-hydroxylating ferredoxin subunit
VPEQDWQAAGARIDTLIAASATGGAVARERAEELVRLVADLYGAGLERILDLLHERGVLSDDVLDALAGDDLVASLLLVHGLHPYGVRSRIEQALAGVRPYLGSHGGDVELIDVTADGVVRLKMLGSCDGCPSSAVTLKLAVEGAIEAAAPEITAIEVEEPAAPPPNGAVIPVASLFARLTDTPGAGAGSSWVAVPEFGGLDPGVVTRLTAGTVAVVACRIGTDLFAFLDGCARCGQSLAGATVARRLGGATGDGILRCPACHAHYDVRRAGACLDDDALHLSPLPLLVEGGTVQIAVPAPVPT